VTVGEFCNRFTTHWPSLVVPLESIGFIHGRSCALTINRAHAQP